jgi:hypothetical protein
VVTVPAAGCPVLCSGEALDVACGFGLRMFGRLDLGGVFGVCRRWMRAASLLLAHQPRVRRVCGQALCRVWPSSPMLGRSPTAGATGSKRRWPSEPPSSSGLGHRPFKAAARVQIPLGALCWPGAASSAYGPVEQLGVLATLSRWRSRVQIPSGPLWPSGHGPRRGQVAQLV